MLKRKKDDEDFIIFEGDGVILNADHQLYLLDNEAIDFAITLIIAVLDRKKISGKAIEEILNETASERPTG